MSNQFTWYLSRTTGLLSWVLLAAATLWGLLLASRLLERRPSPAWLLDLHRHFGALTIVLSTIHVTAIVMDDFVDYTIIESLIPFTSDADRLPVAIGVIALYLLLTVQISSMLRSHMTADWWRHLHSASAPLFILATVHGWLIGTDIGNPVVVVVALVLGAEVLLVLALRVRFGRRALPGRLLQRHQEQRAHR